MFRSSAKKLFEHYENLSDLVEPEQDRVIAEIELNDQTLARELRTMLDDRRFDKAQNSGISEEEISKQTHPGDTGIDSSIQDLRDLTKAFSWNEQTKEYMLGCFRIRECLSIGASGATYQAFDSELHRDVSIFLRYPRFADAPGLRESFLRSARNGARVFHPNVVSILGIIEHPQTVGIVRQWLPGMNLAQWMNSRGQIDLTEIIRIGQNLALGLQSLHDQGVVHRDLKPANIIMRQGSGEAVIIDLGTAELVSETSTLNQVVGTPGFIAPEVLQGKSFDFRSDLYSLGVVLYWLLTGNWPDDKPSHLSLNGIERNQDSSTTDSTRSVINLINEILDSQPDRRPSTANEVAKRLALGTQREINVSPEPAKERVVFYRLSSRRKWINHSVGMTALAAIAFAMGRWGVNRWSKNQSANGKLFVPEKLPDFVGTCNFSLNGQQGILSKENIEVFPDLVSFGKERAWLLGPSIPNHWAEILFAPIEIPEGRFESNLVAFFIFFDAMPGEAIAEIQYSYSGLPRSWQVLRRVESRFQGYDPHTGFESLPPGTLEGAEQVFFKIRLFAYVPMGQHNIIKPVNAACKIHVDRAEALTLALWRNIGNDKEPDRKNTDQ